MYLNCVTFNMRISVGVGVGRLFKFCTWSCFSACAATSSVVGSDAAVLFPTRSTRFSGLVPCVLCCLRVTPAGQNVKRRCSRDRGGGSDCWSCAFRLPRWRSWSLWRWSWGGWRTFQSPSSMTLPTWRGERKRCGTPTVNATVIHDNNSPKNWA